MLTICLIVITLIAVPLIFCFAALRTAKQPIPGAKHTHPAILVIDDNTSVLNMLRLGLENEGYTVLTAAKPQDGIELFRARSKEISLVLLDFCMPAMNGDIVFDCLRKISTDVPVLLITGFCDDMMAAGHLCSQVNGYLIKPFQLGDLLGKVREVVSHI